MTAAVARRTMYGLAVLYTAACIAAWPLLPARMPLHFGFGGGVTSWTQSSAVLWFLLPALGWGVLWLADAVGGEPTAWQLRRESLLRYRELPPDERETVRLAMKRDLHLSLAFFVTCLMSLQAGIFVTAQGSLERMPLLAEAGMWLSILTVLLVSIRRKRRLHRALRPCE